MYLQSNPKEKWICLPVALGGRIAPSGLRKSSRVSSFHVPRSPLVLPLNATGAANIIDKDPTASLTLTDIPDGNVATKESFLGRDTATEPLRVMLVFVKFAKPSKSFPSTSNRSLPEGNKHD